MYAAYTKIANFMQLKNRIIVKAATEISEM